MALTIKALNRLGEFELVDDHGEVCGNGIAYASKTLPGFVTLVATRPLGNTVRVPADWLAILEQTDVQT